MRILLVNKYHYIRGGDCRYVFELAKLLERNKHRVRHFAMHHPKNLPYKHQKEFVPHIDFLEELKKPGLKPKLKSVSKILYSAEARRRFRQVILEFKPDIIHFNNIHKYLTTSILIEANKQKIPVMWTLHDYNLICPNVSFKSQRGICERCKTCRYLAPILEKCSNQSILASTLIAIENLVGDLQGVKRRTNYFISPSEFLRSKFIEFRYPEKKMRVLPYFYALNEYKRWRSKNKYFLYFGRLSHEKGVKTLCEAFRNVNAQLLIVGDGPLREELQREYSSKNIRFLGYKSGKELNDLRREAWFVIVPSEWYENYPFSIIESFSEGVPVIGSRIGGIPELVKNKKTGFLFDHGNTEQLTEVLEEANRISRKNRHVMGMRARDQIKKINDPQDHYDKLIKIYEEAINEENSRWKR